MAKYCLLYSHKGHEGASFLFSLDYIMLFFFYQEWQFLRKSLNLVSQLSRICLKIFISFKHRLY